MAGALHRGADPQEKASGIPLSLGPLLSAYRQHRNLRIRIERLPRNARLSKGQNNGDGTWSLSPDDLDGLLYLPPAEVDVAHAVGVSISSLDGGYATILARRDIVVSPDDEVTGAEPEAPPTGDDSPGVVGQADLRRLRDEFVDIKAALLAREAELADTRQKVEEARADRSRQAIAAEVAAARATWEVELQEKLEATAAAAAQELERKRKAWQAEQAALRAESEAQWRAQLERARVEAKRALDSRETELGQARKDLEIARQAAASDLSAAEARWKAEFEERLQRAAADAATDLDRARAAWRADEDERGAKAEALFASRLAEADEQAAARHEAQLAATEARWQAKFEQEVDRLNAALATRETEVAEARAEADRERQTAQTNLDEVRSAWAVELKSELDRATADANDRLERARAAWQAEQDNRVAGSVEHVRTSADEARERLLASHAAELAEAEARRDALDRALTEVRGTLRARESELVALRAQMDKASKASVDEAKALRAAWDAELAARLDEARSEAAATLAEARASWEADQQKRSAALEKRTQERETEARAAALAEKADELAAVEARWRERQDLAVAEVTAALDARDAELRELRAQEVARPQEQRREIETEVASARADWKAELEARLEEAAASGAAKFEEGRAAWQAEWDERLAEQQRHATERLDQVRKALRQEAEAALSQARERWRAEEAARLARAKSQWREQADRLLAQARSQAQRVDEAQDERGAGAPPASEPHEDTELHRLSEELASMKSTLAARDDELVQARSELELERDCWVEETKSVLTKAQEAWQVEEVQRLLAAREEWKKIGPTVQARSAVGEAAKKLNRARLSRRKVTLLLALAAMVAFIAIEPRVRPLVVERVWPAIVRLAQPPAPPRTEAPAAAAHPQSVRRAVRPDALISVPVANIRSAPATSGTVVATVPRGKKLKVLDRKDGWVRVRTIENGSEPPHEGWIFRTLLRDLDRGDAKR